MLERLYKFSEWTRVVKAIASLWASTCMCSRAVHVEMLDDLSTDAFINALRAFIAIRGPVRQLRSDQGTNFVGAR